MKKTEWFIVATFSILLLIASTSRQEPQVCIAKDLFERNLKVQIKRRNKIRQLQAKIKMLESSIMAKEKSIQKRVLQERIICARSTCPKCPSPAPLLLGVTIPLVALSSVGFFFVGQNQCNNLVRVQHER